MEIVVVAAGFQVDVGIRWGGSSGGSGGSVCNGGDGVEWGFRWMWGWDGVEAVEVVEVVYVAVVVGWNGVTGGCGDGMGWKQWR